MMRATHYLRNQRDMGPVRRVGLQLLAGGATQSEVARELGVSRTAASNWAASLAGAAPALAGHAASCAPSLSVAQSRELAAQLDGSARAHGFPGDEWTTARVAVLIECAFGIACSTVQAWRLRNAARGHAQAAGATVPPRPPVSLAKTPALAAVADAGVFAGIG